MRTLVLTQVAPNPPDAGPKIKTHYALRMLAREHRVELLTFARDEREAAAAAQMGAWCDRVTVVPLRRQRPREPYYLARGWGGRMPFLVARDYRREFSRAIGARLASGELDVVHADQVSMAQYLPVARARGLATVFDAHNAVYDLARDLARRQPTPAHRLAMEIEWRLLRRFEGRQCRESTLTLAVSRDDRDRLAEAAGGPFRAEVIPIGVEAEGISPVPHDPAATNLLSVATMLYPPNREAIRWFRDEVWPRIRQRHAATSVDIVGTRPPADLVRWGAADPRVRVPGYVEDIEALYRRAAVFIVPLHAGSGVRVKILEAMARGVPLVSTSVGVAGLDVRHGEHLLVADTPDDFARAVLHLLHAPEERARLARAARARVLHGYDWRQCYRPLLESYRSLAGGAPRAAAAADLRLPLPR